MLGLLILLTIFLSAQTGISNNVIEKFTRIKRR